MESSDSVSDLEEYDGLADDSMSCDDDINSGTGPSSSTANGKRKVSEVKLEGSAKKRRIDPNSDSLDENIVQVVLETTGAEKKLQNSDDNLDKKETYSAREGLKNSLHGVIYQLKLLMLLLHFAWVQGYRFRLATEMDAAEKFDDVVYEFEESPGSRKQRFLQLKHKQDGSKKKISVHDLLADDGGDFSLIKYFRSWREMQKKPEFKETGTKQFIICTNVGLDKERLKQDQIEVDEVNELDDFLNITPNESQCYRLNPNPQSKLFAVLKSASDLHLLAKELATRVNDRKALDKTAILKRYHVALIAQKIVDKETKMFHDNFIANKQTAQMAVEFRRIFYEHAKEFRDNKKASETDIWNRLKSHTFRISKPFGIKSGVSELEQLPDYNISDQEISDFLQEFILAVNQPNEERLDKLIEKKFGECRYLELLNTNFLKNSFQNDILNWFKSKVGVYLVKEDATKFFDDLKGRLSSLIAVGLSSPYLRKFEKYNVKYKRSDEDLEEFLKSSDPPGNQILLQYTCSEQTLLTASRIYETVKSMKQYMKDDSFIFMELESVILPKIMSLVFYAFSSPENHNLLIIDCGLRSADQNTDALWKVMCRTMKELTEKNITGKRIIIVIPEKNARIIRLGLPHRDLYETEDHISIDKLKRTTRRDLLAKKVIKFQGRHEKTSYACLLETENFDNTGDYRQIVNPPTLVKIIQGTEITIGEKLEGLGEVASFYIPRTIDRHVVIKNDIFKYSEDFGDVFAIGGIDEEILEKLWQDENRKEENSSQERIYRHPNKYVTLLNGREEDDFNTRCREQINCNIHWLQRESGKLIWKQSHGSIENLVQYREETRRNDDADKHGVISLTEEELVQCHANQPQIVILSDTAGMGKSTVLTRLAETIRDNEPSLLVIKINLTDHTKVFDSEQKNERFDSDDYDGAVNFLVDELIPNLKPEAVLVFKTRIKVRREAALLFDGFDEISPHYKETVITLIHALSKLGVKKLFVMTRPHTSGALEEKLGVFSHSLQPFSEVNQVRFFTEFWESRLRLSRNKAAMERHAIRLITLLTETIDRSMQEFTGVPLQTRMVAEVFPYAEVSELAEKLPKSITIIELYRRFVNTKYEIYKKVKSNCDFTKPGYKEKEEGYRKCFSIEHQAFSLKALFDDKIEALFTGKPILIEWCKSSLDGTADEAMVRQGMILRFTEGKPQFIHRTFAEYFAATFLFEILIDDSRNQSVREFFVAKLFVDSEYQVIRAFLNCLLTDKDHVGQKHSWSFFLKQYCDPYGWTAYHIAASERHDGIVKFLLDRLTEDHRLEFSNINCCPEFYDYTPLTIALQTPDNFKVVKCFVDAGANIDYGRSIARETPFHGAIRGDVNFDAIEYILKERDNIESGIMDDVLILAANLGKLDVVKLFEMNGARLHCKNFEPLAEAAGSGNLELVEYLVRKGGKINSHTELYRYTPLYLAARSGRFEVVKYLMENGANIDAEYILGETPLHEAASSGHLDVVKYLINQGANIHSKTDNGFTLLHSAASCPKRAGIRHASSNLDVVGHLVERGASIHSLTHANETPLHLAARSQELDIVKYLVERGADIHHRNLHGATPLHYAADVWMHQVDRDYRNATDGANIVKFLIEHGANIDSSDNFDRTVMHHAAKCGRVEVVKLLTEKGASIHSPDCFGETPLHLAAQIRNLDLVQYLIKEGANIRSETIRGKTPVYFAVRSGGIDVVEYLLEQGAGIHVETKDCESLLHPAVKSCSLDIVKYLIEKGVTDIQTRTKDGKTLLHYAARFGNLNVVKFFTEKGLNINSANKKGKTPLHEAALRGTRGVVKYLTENGAIIDCRTHDGRTPVHYAAVHSYNHDTVKYLVEKGVDILSQTGDGTTLLHLAARSGNLDLVQYLMQKGADIRSETKRGETPLYFAAESGEIDLVQYLVEQGADILVETEDGQTTLHLAARSGNLELLAYFSERVKNVHPLTRSGDTLLHFAATSCNLVIVRHLIQSGVSIHSVNYHNETPLHSAVEFGKIDAVRYLLDNGADVNSRTYNGETLLHYASKSRLSCRSDLDLVQFLLEKGIDINSRTATGATALQIAVQNGELADVKHLMEHGANLEYSDYCGRTAMHYAAGCGRIEVVKLLTEKGANIRSSDYFGGTPLHVAALSGDLDLVQYLMKEGADIHSETERGETPMYSGVRSGKIDLVKYLAEQGADIHAETTDCETLLHPAVKSGFLDIVEYLIENGVAEGGKTLIHHAAASRNSDLVKFLVEKGVDINFKTEEGETPLHQAARRGILDVVKDLTENGANIDTPTNDGRTPMHYAARFDHLDVMEFLVKRGANIHFQTKDGTTPLHSAAAFRRTDIVKHLAANGADIHSPDRYGQTPLHLAALCDALEVVKFLTNAGADVHCRNQNGRTPLQVAVKHRAITVRKYLMRTVAESPPRTT